MMKGMVWLAGIAQMLILAAVVALEFLSGQRGGVNHHVLARKQQWSQGLLSAERLQLMDISFGILALLMLWFLSRKRIQGTTEAAEIRSVTANVLVGVCLILLTVLSHRLPIFLNLRASSYATLALAAAVLIQLGLVVAVSFSASKPKKSSS